MRCLRRLLNISFKDQVLTCNTDVEIIKQPLDNMTCPTHCQETEANAVWAHFKVGWLSEGDSIEHSERKSRGGRQKKRSKDSFQ